MESSNNNNNHTLSTTTTTTSTPSSPPAPSTTTTTIATTATTMATTAKQFPYNKNANNVKEEGHTCMFCGNFFARSNNLTQHIMSRHTREAETRRLKDAAPDALSAVEEAILLTLRVNLCVQRQLAVSGVGSPPSTDATDMDATDAGAPAPEPFEYRAAPQRVARAPVTTAPVTAGATRQRGRPSKKAKTGGVLSPSAVDTLPPFPLPHTSNHITHAVPVPKQIAPQMYPAPFTPTINAMQPVPITIAGATSMGDLPPLRKPLTGPAVTKKRRMDADGL